MILLWRKDFRLFLLVSQAVPSRKFVVVVNAYPSYFLFIEVNVAVVAYCLSELLAQWPVPSSGH